MNTAMCRAALFGLAVRYVRSLSRISANISLALNGDKGRQCNSLVMEPPGKVPGSRIIPEGGVECRILTTESPVLRHARS